MAFPQNASKKQSQFTQVDAVPSGAYFGLWGNSANYRISFENLLADLGATGTLSQLGDGGQPLLYQAGSSNYIRNLKAGFGLKLTQEPTDEVTVAIGYTFDTTGATLVDSVTAPEPVFRSLVAGSGISLAPAAGTIQISTGSPVPTNSVVVASMSDFPAPVSGVRTLAPSTNYLVVNNLTTSDRFVMQDKTSLGGSAQVTSSITYTGTGDMFTWADASIKFNNITLKAPSGSMFNGVNTVASTYTLTLDLLTLEANTIGTIGTLLGSRMYGITFTSATNGLLFTGDVGYVVIDSCLVQQALGTAVRLGTCTFDGFSVQNSILLGGDPSVFYITGLANSGNVKAGGLGVLLNNRSNGVGNPTDGTITSDDALWQFSLNDTIPDTRPDSLLSFINNTSTTTIVTPGVPVAINATYVENRVSQMSSAAGVVTYNGGKSTTVPITAAGTLKMASGGTLKTVCLAIAINGTVVANSTARGVCSNTQTVRLTTIWQYRLNPTDTVQIRVCNETDTAGVIVSDLVFRIN